MPGVPGRHPGACRGAAPEAFRRFRKMPSLSQILKDSTRPSSSSTPRRRGPRSGSLPSALHGPRWSTRKDEAGCGHLRMPRTSLARRSPTSGCLRLLRGAGLGALASARTAMAVRAWNGASSRRGPCSPATRALAVVAQAVGRPGEASIIADARRGAVAPRPGLGGPLERVAATRPRRASS